MQRDFAHSVRGWMSLFVFLLTGAAWISPAQSVKDETNDVAALRVEVRQLALELLECRAELVQWKVHLINAELLQVQAERQRIAAVLGVPVENISWGHKTPIQHLYGHGPG